MNYLKGICGNIYQNLKEVCMYVLETGKSSIENISYLHQNAQSHIKMDLGLGSFMKPLFSLALY